VDIKDNGVGMSRKTIQEAWCVVATPYRQSNPLATKGKKTRRVAGEKGLGRLSAARLGKKLWMLTKSATEPCWSVEVDWSILSEKESLDNCFVRRRNTKDPVLAGVNFTRKSTVMQLDFAANQ
jgi:hypothetical protein